MARTTLPQAIQSGFLTPGQLAKLVNVSPPTIRNMCKAGKLEHSTRPSNRMEVIINAAMALYQFTEQGFFSHLKPPPAPFIAAAKHGLVWMANNQPDNYKKIVPHLAPLLANKPIAS